MVAAYLDADASALADREPRPLTDSALLELEYAADLFRRADSALSAEVSRLSGLAVQIDLGAVRKACNTLVCAAVELRIHALREHERRAA